MKGLKTWGIVCMLSVSTGIPVALAKERAVVNVSEDPLMTYDSQADYFVEGKAIAKRDLTLPLAIMEESPRGYLKVRIQGREAWLDLMDVTIDPPLLTKSPGCIPTGLAQTSGTGRGIGGPC